MFVARSLTQVRLAGNAKQDDGDQICQMSGIRGLESDAEPDDCDTVS